MKCPGETIEKFRKFNENIAKEEWRVNFVLTLGYLKFISDLEAEAIKLKQACRKILDDYGCE